jgi:hypothetical protein
MKTIRSFASAAALALAAVAAPLPALANTAIQFMGVGNTFDSLTGSEMIGWAFTANANLSVTKFGWFVVNPSLNSFHDVGMWDASGTLLAQSTVLAPRSGDENGFTFVSTAFTAFTLTAGQTYFIGGRETASDADRYVTNLDFLQTDPAITFVGAARSASATGFAFPGLVQPGVRGRFGPNFKFDVLPDPDPVDPGPGVPEPATWAMLILGFGAAGAALRRRRQDAAAVAA